MTENKIWYMAVAVVTRQQQRNDDEKNPCIANLFCKKKVLHRVHLMGGEKIVIHKHFNGI